MFKHFTHVALLLIGIMVGALAWGISPVMTKPTSAEITTERSEPPVFLTSAFKIVNPGGQVRTIVRLWDGNSPFLAVEEGQRVPQWSCLTGQPNVTKLVIREIRKTREWPTNLHSITDPGVVHEESYTTCEYTFSPRMKGGAGSVFAKRTDTPGAVSTPFYESSGPMTFLFSGKKDNEKHDIAIY